MAHGLKGNAAQIGANPVSELAAALELACRAQREDLLEGDAFKQMSDQLSRLVANISKWNAQRSAEAARPDALEQAELRELCEELFSLLNRDDFASYRLLKKHEAILRSAFGAECAALLDSVGNFDLARAADQLKKLAAVSGIELK